MKIAVIGATGFVGSNIVSELANRGHQIIAIARNPEKLNTDKKNIRLIKADVKNESELTQILKGNDVIVSAFNAGWENPNLYNDFLEGSKAIEKAVKQSKAGRFIVIGGAGSLYAAPDLQMVDTPEFPEHIKPGATAARDYLNILKQEKDLDWAFFSPAPEMHPGITTGRTGEYRLGLDSPVIDAEGKSKLSVEDLAVVIADEIEKPKHHKQRFTGSSTKLGDKLIFL